MRWQIVADAWLDANYEELWTRIRAPPALAAAEERIEFANLLLHCALFLESMGKNPDQALAIIRMIVASDQEALLFTCALAL